MKKRNAEEKKRRREMKKRKQNMMKKFGGLRERKEEMIKVKEERQKFRREGRALPRLKSKAGGVRVTHDQGKNEPGTCQSDEGLVDSSKDGALR